MRHEEDHGVDHAALFRAMLAYNAVAAAFLAWFGMREPHVGSLLWPAVVLHSALTVLLVWTKREQR